MHKVTIILGPNGSGKTTKALELCKGKKAVWLTNINLRNLYPYSEVEIDTDIIVIDEAANMPIVNYLIYSVAIVCQKPHGEFCLREMPEIILTSNFITEMHFIRSPHIQFITLSHLHKSESILNN